MSSIKPTIKELNTCLKDLVEWNEFALYLPDIHQRDIKIIIENNPYIVNQKIALYDKWLNVSPNASWDDVINALEEVGENTIAQQLKDRRDKHGSRKRASPALQELNGVGHSPSDSRPPSRKRALLEVSENVDISEKIVTELNSLQHSFVSLAHNVKVEVENKTKTSDDVNNIKFITRHVQEERAYPIESLETVETTDQLFKAILPHYNFLNCYLIVSIALFLSGIIAEKASEYKQSVETFMKRKTIKELQHVLRRYYRIFRASNNSNDIQIVEITVENGWGDQNLWLVEMLVKTLFRVKYSDELLWCDIVPGSVVMTFVAFKPMTSSLIECSKEKIEFMRLIGVISLKIGDRIVWQKDEKDINAFSFEDSLIRATLANNIETVQFLLQNTQVDVNTRNTFVKLIDVNEEMYESESDVMDVLRSFHATFHAIFDDASLCETPSIHINPSLDSGVGDNNEIPGPRIEACNNFLNGKLLTHYVQQSEALLERLARYNKMNDGYKKSALLLYLQKPLLQYIPDPFPGSVEVVVTLHDAWSACSVWYFEQLGQLVFAPIRFQQHLQLFRVDICAISKLVKVVLLADRESMDVNFIKECLCNESSMTTLLLGIVSVKVGGNPVITNDDTIQYSFNKAIDEAKALKNNDKIVDLLLQIRQSPVDFNFTSADTNNNRCFLPDPDSTSLMIACCNDNSQLVQLLLEANSDPNIHTRDGITALMYSAGNSTIFQMLLRHGAEINRIDSFDETSMHYACKAGNAKVVGIILAEDRYLVNVTNDDGETPLYFASENGHETTVEALLHGQADPNVQSMEGNTALKIASKNGHTAVVQRLLRAHANPNLQNTEGCTALIDACSEGHAEIIELLLQANADLTLCDDQGLTALEHASTNSHQHVVDILETWRKNT